MVKGAMDEEFKRNLKWVTYAKPKIVFGFEHLSPAYVPAMANKAKGMSIVFEKISGWCPPSSLLKELDAGGFSLTVQLSFSLFHLNSKSFFGSTWMGQPVPLGDGTSQLPDVIEFDYDEIIYMISRIIDPSCVGVVEIVASKIDNKRNIIAAQYGYDYFLSNYSYLYSFTSHTFKLL